MPTIRANDLEIAYEVVGKRAAAGPAPRRDDDRPRDVRGPDPGARRRPSSSILPDARGHGRTRWDAADGFEAAWLVDDLEAFVDGLGLRTFHLIGFSMGAMTALGFAVRAPERLRTLVVVGITAAREPRAAVGAPADGPRADRCATTRPGRPRWH